MKKLGTALVLSFFLFGHKSDAQVTQFEVASGIPKSDFTYFSLQPVNPKGTFSISTLAFFQKFHHEEDEIFDEVGVQPTLYWNLNKWFSMGPSLYYNSVAGFSERISVQFSKKSSKYFLTFAPTVAHSEETKFINGELFVQLQFRRPIKENWQFVLNAQLLTIWDKFKTHSRSFQQLRTGVSFKTTQFGIALDFDQYGGKPETKTLIGVFIRKLILHKHS